MASSGLVAAATLSLLVIRVVPEFLGTPEYAWDAAGHTLASATLRDRFLPALTGWNPSVLCGYAQGEFYPPLTHALIAVIGLVAPLGLAFRIVVGAAVLAVPASAYAFGRTHRLGRGAASVGALAATGLLFVTHATLRLSADPGGDLDSTFGTGLTANAVAIPLFLLAGAAAPRALRRRRGAWLCGVLVGLSVLNHLVGGLAAAGLVTSEAVVRTTATRRWPSRLAAFGEIVLHASILTAWWMVPFMADRQLTRILHLPSELGPAMAMALCALVLALLFGTRSRVRALATSGAAALCVVGIVSAMWAGDRLLVGAHLYRLTMFGLLCAALAVTGVLRSRRSVQAGGIAAAAFLIAMAHHAVLESGPVTMAPPITVPAGLTPNDRVLVATATGHDWSAHYLESEFPRRAGCHGLIGLFVESTPLARWLVDLARAVVFDTFVWGIPNDAQMTAPIACDATEPELASTERSHLACMLIGRRLEEVGATHIVSDRRPPPELVDPTAPAPVVCRVPTTAESIDGFEVAAGARIFRLYQLRKRPNLAEVLSEPTSPVGRDDESGWDRAVARWMFDIAGAMPRPIGSVSETAPASAGVSIGAQASVDGRTIELNIASNSDVPVTVRVGWHPAWRAHDSEGVSIPVDRIAPGLCVVRGHGRITMTFGRRWIDWAGYALGMAGLAVTALLHWRKHSSARALRSRMKNTTLI